MIKIKQNLPVLYNWFYRLDKWLIIPILLLFIVNLTVQYSANDESFNRLISDLVYLLLSLMTMFVIANLHYVKLKAMAVPLYIFTIILLVLVLLIGVKINGSQRWLDLSFIRMQPSELAKLSTPLMIAYVFSLRDDKLNWIDYFIGFLIILLPFALIVKQPDLGTSILVVASGFFVLFLAGLYWKLIISGIILFFASTPLLWHFLHDYQKHRILTLLDPQSDPLGKGYHVIQGIIAIGSGGFWGKGYLDGSQVHLDFIPEKHTDFVITVIAEEFGFVGIITVLSLYGWIIFRCLKIMRETDNIFAGTIVGAITLSFTLYILINMGMVAGILPVVGVPLPLISYGGTATIVIMIGFGIILSIDKHNHYDV